MSSAAPRSAATLSIGELSRRAGVNIETIRYYERIKILPAPPRTTGGRRAYGPAETRSLTFIRRSRELGFSLDEIRALLALAIMLVFASMIVTTYAYRRNPDLIRDSGMTELPWITLHGIWFIRFIQTYWFVLAPVFGAAATLAGFGFLGRGSKGAVAAVLVLALAIPVFGYVALEKPLAELELKLHQNQHR